MTINPEEDCFGSARWASLAEIARAGLFRPGGLFLGFFDRRPLYVPGQAPLSIGGGQGRQAP